MTPTSASCPECGARVTSGADRCDLCGHGLDQEPAPALEDAESTDVSQETPAPSQAAVEETPAAAPPTEPAREVRYCGQCGAQNPIEGRFCTMCGTPLGSRPDADLPGPRAPAGVATLAATPSESGSVFGKKALGWASAVLAVALMLFAVDRLSGTPDPPVDEPAPVAQDANTPPASPPAGSVSAPVTATPEVEERIAAIEADIEAAGSEAERIGKRIELVETFARAGLYGRAAEAQAALAEVTQTAAAWATAGTLWLDHIPQVGPEEQAMVALRSINAYQTALGIEDDPDVRVNLALAYQYDPETPMGTVEQLQTVLETYPDHPEANFNMGLMRARIGRLDQAIASMEKVIAVTDHDNPVHQRAELELAQLRQQAQEQG